MSKTTKILSLGILLPVFSFESYQICPSSFKIRYLTDSLVDKKIPSLSNLELKL